MKTAQQQVAVWDTYSHRPDGSVLHFDIIVPDDLKDKDKIYGFGRQYLKAKGYPETTINAERCQFCHIEETSSEITKTISKQGFYILEMDDIPANLPLNANKRDMVLHLKAHFEQYRFRNFSGVPLEEIQKIIVRETNKNQQH